MTVRQPLDIEFDNTYPLFHEVDLLLEAYSVLSAKAPDKPLRAQVFSEIVSKTFASVNSKIIRLLRILYKNGECYMGDLYIDIKDRSEQVAMFLAVLELTKSGRIVLNDDNTMIAFRAVNSEQLTVNS